MQFQRPAAGRVQQGHSSASLCNCCSVPRWVSIRKRSSRPPSGSSRPPASRLSLRFSRIRRSALAAPTRRTSLAFGHFRESSESRTLLQRLQKHRRAEVPFQSTIRQASRERMHRRLKSDERGASRSGWKQVRPEHQPVNAPHRLIPLDGHPVLSLSCGPLAALYRWLPRLLHARPQRRWQNSINLHAMGSEVPRFTSSVRPEYAYRIEGKGIAADIAKPPSSPVALFGGLRRTRSVGDRRHARHVG